ncbi:MAG: protein-L-isoaspartate(D-aspartate) O-methyltransferase, partial [Streptomyces sp.]|nr:protein-L-isoaspartate(D-aspartate) O-methyltransferase [Streptomyces sp.]
MSDDKALRMGLAERLIAGGHLHTDPWRAAVECVSRHEFLRGGYFQRADSPGPTAWRPVLPDD